MQLLCEFVAIHGWWAGNANCPRWSRFKERQGSGFDWRQSRIFDAGLHGVSLLLLGCVRRKLTADDPGEPREAMGPTAVSRSLYCGLQDSEYKAKVKRIFGEGRSWVFSFGVCR
jgi:hypothetical protein